MTTDPDTVSGMVLKRKKCKVDPDTLSRDVNCIIKNSLKMPGSRGHIGPGEVKGNALVGGPREQRLLRETEFSHFYSLKIHLSRTEVG